MKIALALLAWLISTSAVEAGTAAAPLPVTASFSILGDMVEQVGGEQVAVTTLVGPDGDAHSFEPTPSHLRQITHAKLLFINGLGFEGWMDRLQRSADYKGKVIVVSAGVQPLMTEDEHDEHDEHDTHDGHSGHTHGHASDPHAWQDISNGIIYVRNISDALKEALPQHANAIDARATAYIDRLREKDARIRADIARIAPEHRVVITSHDAFGYFGRAYGVDFKAPVGLSTDAEASAQIMMRLVKQIRDHGIHTVFVENMADPRLSQQLAREAHAKIGGTLYADALSAKGGSAATYLDMFDNNVQKLIPAMKEITRP